MENTFLAIGGAHWDILGRSAREMKLYDDMPGRIKRMIGGVSGPIAMKLGQLGAPIALIGYAGRDELGDALLAKLTEYHVNCGHMIRDQHPTDVYMAVEAPNGMIAAIADCHSLEAVSERCADEFLDKMNAQTFGIIDGNLTEAALTRLAQTPMQAASLDLIPASPGKIQRFVPFFNGANPFRMVLNLNEANILLNAEYSNSEMAAQELIKLGASEVLVSDGAKSACAANAHAQHVAEPPQITVKRFTGAGDTLSAHYLYARARADDLPQALNFALHATAKFISQEDLDA